MGCHYGITIYIVIREFPRIMHKYAVLYKVSIFPLTNAIYKHVQEQCHAYVMYNDPELPDPNWHISILLATAHTSSYGFTVTYIHICTAMTLIVGDKQTNECRHNM